MEINVKVVRRGTNAIPVFVFTHADFPDKKLYSANQYIHVTQDGTEDSICVLYEAPVLSAGSGGIGALEVDRNDHTDGAESNDAPNLLLGCTSNIHSEDMAEIKRQGIAVEDDNNIAP